MPIMSSPTCKCEWDPIMTSYWWSSHQDTKQGYVWMMISYAPFMGDIGTGSEWAPFKSSIVKPVTSRPLIWYQTWLYFVLTFNDPLLRGVEPELKVSETRLTFQMIIIPETHWNPWRFKTVFNASQTPESHFIPVCFRFGNSNLLGLAPLNS